MKHTKRILAFVVTFIMAFAVLGGQRIALAADADVTIGDAQASANLTTAIAAVLTANNEVVTTGAAWRGPGGEAAYLDFTPASGDVTTSAATKRNTTSPLTFSISVADAATPTVHKRDRTVNVTVYFSVTLAFASGYNTPLVKGGTLDMLTLLTTAVPNNSSVTWTVSGNGNLTGSTLTATGAGTATVTVTSTIDPSKKATISITTIVPSIALTSNVTNNLISAVNGKTTLTARLTDNGSPTVTPTSAVTWSSSDSSILSLNATGGNFAAGTATVEVTGLKEGNATITCTSAADNSIRATINIGVGSGLYLDLVGPNLNKTNRTGEYKVYVKDAAGNVSKAKDGTVVHWDWSSSYLSLSDGGARSPIQNGEAHIHLRARANSPSNGTRVYVWLHGGNKIYHTVYITGLSSLPQSGQDFTLVYVLGAACLAMLLAAGVWYGVRKKRNEA